jgi:hypothetical protein
MFAVQEDISAQIAQKIEAQLIHKPQVNSPCEVPV